MREDEQGVIDLKWIAVIDEEPEYEQSYLWAKFPICEAPWVGSVGDSEWLRLRLDDYFTHYMKMDNSFFYSKLK